VITTLIVFAYVFLIATGVGLIFRIFLDKLGFTSENELKEIAIDLYFIFGLIILSIFLAVFSLFSKIGLLANIIVGIFVLGGAIIYREEFRKLIQRNLSFLSLRTPNVFFLVLWPVFLILLLYSVGLMQVYDVNLYHAQTIKWVGSFKVIPGLAWIHSRFGFNSHFHLLSAFFSMSFLDISREGLPIVFYPVNSLLYFIFFCRVINAAKKAVAQNLSWKVFFYGAVFIISFFCFARVIQSPTPDVIVAIFIFYAFFLYQENINPDEPGTSWNFCWLLFALIILVLPTFKISAGLLMVFLLCLFIQKRPSVKIIKLLLFVGVVIFIPYLIRNVLLSGYLVYPLHQIDIFNVDWKFSYELTLKDSNVIKTWARVASSDPAVLSMPYSEWMPTWWEIHNRDINRIIFLVTLISPVIIAVMFLIRRNRINKKDLIMYGVCALNILFWFMSAPDPRFAWGFFGILVSLSLAMIVRLFNINAKTVLILLFAFMIMAISNQQEYWTYMLPSDYRKGLTVYPSQLPFKEMQQLKLDSITLQVPLNNDDRCYYAKLPCSPMPLPHVHLRTGSIEDGFYGTLK
jgi:hypothetical protein